MNDSSSGKVVLHIAGWPTKKAIIYIDNKKKIHSTCEMDDFVETHLCKLCVIR